MTKVERQRRNTESQKRKAGRKRRKTGATLVLAGVACMVVLGIVLSALPSESEREEADRAALEKLTGTKGPVNMVESPSRVVPRPPTPRPPQGTESPQGGDAEPPARATLSGTKRRQGETDVAYEARQSALKMWERFAKRVGTMPPEQEAVLMRVLGDAQMTWKVEREAFASISLKEGHDDVKGAVRTSIDAFRDEVFRRVGEVLSPEQLDAFKQTMRSPGMFLSAEPIDLDAHAYAANGVAEK